MMFIKVSISYKMFITNLVSYEAKDFKPQLWPSSIQQVWAKLGQAGAVAENSVSQLVN